MDQIKFECGEFQSFTATRSFALGNTNVRIENGTTLEFDGVTVKYAGVDYSFPQLRGALASGWIVLTKDYKRDNPDYGKPAAAQIRVGSATKGEQPKAMATTVEADERIVMNTSDHAANTKVTNRRTASYAGSDGVPVRTLKTPAVSQTNMVEAQSVLTALEEIEITPVQGVTVDEMLARMSPEQREEYVTKKEAAKATHVQITSGSGKVVGKIKLSKEPDRQEGITASQSSGGGIETWDGGDASVVAAMGNGKSQHVEDGITFTNINVTPPKPPKKEPKPPRAMSADLRLKIAKAMCPDFPDSYDFAASAKKKLARLQADFEDRIDILRAVFAAEDDDLKAKLVQEFPQAFA